MTAFTERMRARLPDGMVLPAPIAALFDWIEARGLLQPSARFKGDRVGWLQRPDPPYAGTVVLFRVETQAQAAESAAWFGRSPDPETARRLVPFARTGGDGSQAAFWLDDDGRQRIVHLGSEGLACCLGETPLDFLRLCAIGYGEISGAALDGPALPPDPSGQVLNAPFVAWLTSMLSVQVPATASEIVGEHPGDDPGDPFTRWVNAHRT